MKCKFQSGDDVVCKDWNPILNWKLMSGSHKFPGPDGGTCINEAAIVAAGFKYRAVHSADDCPLCFSRVIAGYALRLNDAMDGDLRQELLMPYVVRLAGTADTLKVEIARARHIALETIRRILSLGLRTAGLTAHADRCANAEDLNAAYAAANAAAADAAYAAYAANAAAHAADAAYAADVAYAANAAADAAYATAHAAHRKGIFTIAVAILDEAICLGKQADPIEVGVVIARMGAARQRHEAA